MNRTPRAAHSLPPLWKVLLGPMVWLALLCAAAPAQSSGDLAKETNKILREAERKMFNGKNDEAIAQLLVAAKNVQKIAADDSKNRQLRGLQSKLERLRKQLARKTGKTIDLEAGTVTEAGDDESKGKGGKQNGTATPAASGKLPSAVTYRLKQLDRPLTNAEKRIADDKSVTSKESRIKSARYDLDSARSIMAEIHKRYGDKIPAGNAEIAAAEARIARVAKLLEDFTAKVGSEKAAEAEKDKLREADAKKWLARLQPYLLGPSQAGHVPGKYLVAAGTANIEELKKRKAIYDEAKKVFAEYEAAEHVAGKTFELERAEKEMRRALSDFEEGYASSQGNMLELANSRLDEAIAFFDSKPEWRKDPTIKPYTYSADRMAGLEKLVARAAEGAADNPGLPAIRAKFKKLVELNDERRKARTARTYMTPDRYEAADIADIKKASQQAVTRKFAGVTFLRTTVISPTWKEERVLESTDSTNTAVRYRITRRLVAQVAGKTKEGTTLYTVNVEKDKQSDGTWGPLKSHVMFRDAMLEKNVPLAAPTKK